MLPKKEVISDHFAGANSINDASTDLASMASVDHANDASADRESASIAEPRNEEMEVDSGHQALSAEKLQPGLGVDTSNNAQPSPIARKSVS